MKFDEWMTKGDEQTGIGESSCFTTMSMLGKYDSDKYVNSSLIPNQMTETFASDLWSLYKATDNSQAYKNLLIKAIIVEN